MPVIVFGLPADWTDEPDPEECSMCGELQVQLAYVRFEEMLLGICPDCASALNRAHAHMSAKRMERQERARQ